MSHKILITSDSTTDLSEALRTRYGVRILPLSITLGDCTYTDGVDIDPDLIYDHYAKTGTLPKTSATNVATCRDFFVKFVDEGWEIVHFTISSDMSSGYQNAVIASEDLDDVHIVDTRNLSTGGGLLVLTAGELVKTGDYTAGEIAEICREAAKRVDASFVIDSLEFLYKGGRCSALAAFGANMLSLKPCIAVTNGKMDVARKYRGKFEKVLKKYIHEQLGDLETIEPNFCFITHAGVDPALVEMCAEQVRAMGYFEEVFVTHAGCTISAHCGPNTLGVLFIRKA